MLIQVIPDVHGRHVETRGDADHVICLGDYYDSDMRSYQAQVTSYHKLAKCKRHRPEKTWLLLGNHDVQYMEMPHQNYHLRCGSDYQEGRAEEIYKRFQKDRDLFQHAKCIDTPAGPILFTHAGVSVAWINLMGQFIVDPADPFEIEQIVNGEPGELFWSNWKTHGGSDPLDGPLWVRPGELLEQGLPPFRQIVGHTHNQPQFLHQGKGTVQVVDHGFSTLLRFEE